MDLSRLPEFLLGMGLVLIGCMSMGCAIAWLGNRLDRRAEDDRRDDDATRGI